MTCNVLEKKERTLEKSAWRFAVMAAPRQSHRLSSVSIPLSHQSLNRTARKKWANRATTAGVSESWAYLSFSRIPPKSRTKARRLMNRVKPKAPIVIMHDVYQVRNMLLHTSGAKIFKMQWRQHAFGEQNGPGMGNFAYFNNPRPR
jgi:hypothetical protein